MKTSEFYAEVDKLADTFDNRDLDQYLLALYGVVEENKSEKLTYALILKMFKDAFIAEPVKFQTQWLAISEAPVKKSQLERGFVDLEAESLKTTMESYNHYGYTLGVLRFQIAELQKMKGRQLENEFRYFGVESATGNFWYNFDPFSILECGARCMVESNDENPFLDWSFIGDLLEYGRVYE